MLNSRFIDPYGGKLRSLERNIIRYRTVQIALLLYYAEELKQLIVGSVISTENFYKNLRGASYKVRLEQGAKGASKKALKLLVQDGVLSESEANDCKNVFVSRNNSAHEIQVMLADLSNVTFAKNHSEHNVKRHDYTTVEIARKYIELIWERLPTKEYVTPLGMSQLLFSASERFYQEELKRLDKIIKSQHVRRKKQNNDLKKEIFQLNSKLDESQHPGDPICKYDNGTLTQHGINVCYRLFDEGASAEAVAHMMSMSIDAARGRKKMWKNRVENTKTSA
ncbi:MAG: hypothetical protein CMI63_09330 [Parvularcula sp.]|nr:hypothetical protein [Parvularcula sp.]